ncbi:hypothetical protein KC19_1G091500 [Ceratodon purpureus]|uniref:Secreted protein n=1 Tax=Ceratodon purpureus TaxID=3225 RepID=A0A8T0J5N3_CERPU|nr:hypothetical protein KC19_1G091500 [Ceratodon purpureus]
MAFFSFLFFLLPFSLYSYRCNGFGSMTLDLKLALLLCEHRICRQFKILLRRRGCVCFY